MKTLLSNIIILIIQIYQNTLSKILPSVCKFSPSCSNYMLEAVKKYGFFKGVGIGLIRISRCHPFSKSNGWDPVK